MKNESDKIILGALKEAGELCNTYLGSEHLLLAILRDETLLVTKLLNAQGITYKEIRQEIQSLNYWYGVGNELQGYSPVVKHILQQCEDSTSMLLAMIDQQDCLAACILSQHTFKMENILH